MKGKIFNANEAIDPTMAIIEKINNRKEELKSDLIKCAAFIANIKGEITKGKLRWHGIKLKEKSLINCREYSVWQRGAMITPTLKIYDPKIENKKLVLDFSICPKTYLKALESIKANSKFSTQEINLKSNWTD
jgi:hypothetical protein